MDIWNDDKIKLNRIIKEGYEILIVWESDYRKNKKNVINDCIKFLNQ
jgi:G:T-mismatch repair DNA endonuclease (very short patch repair protein)